MSDNVKTVAGIYEAFGRGDIPAVLDQLAEDVEWEPGIRETNVPYYVAGRGKEAAAAFFANLAANFEITHFEVLAICDGGDVVVGVNRYAGRVVGGGDVGMDTECHVWKFDADGKVAMFNHVIDLFKHEQAFAQRA